MESASNYYVTTFYRFQKLSLIENSLEAVQAKLEEKAAELNVQGLVIIGAEGFNSTVAAHSPETFAAFKAFIREYFHAPDLFFKDSESPKAPFKRFKVKIRDEIVTTGAPELSPHSEQNHHLSPAEWDKVLKEEKDILVVDTRNWYETKIGTFKNAINPRIDKFTEFPEFVEKNKIPKDKKLLIFCTGGIRCEKGILELQRQGFDNVYQLEGGILNYLKQFPNSEYEGECFVFDHRVALDQNLQPTQKYGLCPHCGQPSEKTIVCKRCDSEEMICVDCAELEWKNVTCSKNCAYQYELHPERKAPRQMTGKRFSPAP